MKKLTFFIDTSAAIENKKSDSKYSQPNLSKHSQIEYLTISSWNEIVVNCREGPLLETLLLIYTELLQREQGQFTPDITCICNDSQLQAVVKKTTVRLFSRLSNFFHRYPHGRYLTFLNNKYLMLSINKKEVAVECLSSNYELKQKLRQPLDHCSPVTMDALTMADHPLALFADHFVPDSLQVFFRPRGKAADLTLIDERGGWFEMSADFSRGHASLQPFHRFLRAVNERCYDKPVSQVGPMDILPINFYQVLYGKSGWYVEPCVISSRLSADGPLALYATAEYHQQQYQFVVQYGDQQFSEVHHGAEALLSLAKLIKASHVGKEGWPFSIVDLDLSPCQPYLTKTSQLQTIHYLKIKNLLEMKLNRALTAL